MGKAWYKFGAIAIPRTQNRYLLMLITISIVIGVVVLPIILQPSIAFFNLDDAYIYHKYALNLAQGHFLKYSINEPYTNGNTSFLYYLLYTLSVLIGNYITSFYSQSIQFVVIQIVVLIMNLLLFTIAYIYFIKIIDILRPSLQTKPLNKNSIESVGIGSILFLQSNVVIASFSGLEVALSVFLLTIILYMFLTYRWGGGLSF